MLLRLSVPVHVLFGCLAGCLPGCLAGCLAGCLVACLAGLLAAWLVCPVIMLTCTQDHELRIPALPPLCGVLCLSSQIEKHLNKHAEWAAGKDGTAEVSVSTDLLNQVCNGEWVSVYRR